MALTHIRPPTSLLIELEDLSSSCHDFIEVIDTSNFLPPNFPIEPLKEIVSGLSLLKDGTAEGCRVPLEYARLRLPSIRREFTSKSNENDEKDEPSLERGLGVDKALTTLIASVTTSLDEYRVLASETAIDTIDIEPINSIQGNEISKIIAKSKKISSELDYAIDEFDHIRAQGSDKADRFKRSLVSLEATNKLARSELRFKSSVSRWVRSLSNQLEKWPKLVRSASKALKVTHDISKPFISRWNELNTKFMDSIFEAVEGLSNDLNTVAEKAEAHGKTKKIKTPKREPDIAMSFEHWAVNLIEKRETRPNEGVSPELFFAEIKHLTGINSSEFARVRHKQSFKSLVADSPFFELVDQGHANYSVRAASSDQINSTLSNYERRTWVWIVGLARRKIDFEEDAFLQWQEVSDYISKFAFMDRIWKTYSAFTGQTLWQYLEEKRMVLFKNTANDEIHKVIFKP